MPTDVSIIDENDESNITNYFMSKLAEHFYKSLDER